MYDLSFKMRYRSELLLLLIPAISAIFLITDYNVFFASTAQAQRQSQSSATVCNGGSCFTTLCTNDQPCQTFSSNQPSFVQPAQEVPTTTTQPVKEIPIMQSAEEPNVMQPVDEATEQPIEVPVEVCDDGLDNDDDGEVDEECGAATFASASPLQGQLKSHGDGGSDSLDGNNGEIAEEDEQPGEEGGGGDGDNGDEGDTGGDKSEGGE